MSDRGALCLSALGSFVCAGIAFLTVQAYERMRKRQMIKYRPMLIEETHGKIDWLSLTPEQTESKLLDAVLGLPGHLFDQKDVAMAILRTKGFGDDLLGPDTLSANYYVALAHRILFLMSSSYQSQQE